GVSARFWIGAGVALRRQVPEAVLGWPGCRFCCAVHAASARICGGTVWTMVGLFARRPPRIWRCPPLFQGCTLAVATLWNVLAPVGLSGSGVFCGAVHSGPVLVATAPWR